MANQRIHAVQVFLHEKNGGLVGQPPRLFRSAGMAWSAAHKYAGWFPAVVAWSRGEDSDTGRPARILYRAGDIPPEFRPLAAFEDWREAERILAPDRDRTQSKR
jgi:hypothetical protein